MPGLPFGDDFRAMLSSNLARFERRSAPAEGLHLAAVAVVVVPDARERAAVVLTVRAAGLRRHGGQWACPGGRRDPGETPEAAALRELEEEIGLSLPADHVLGCLDDYPTRSGFVITPVVVWGSGDALRPDPREVAKVYLLPLDELTPEKVVLQAGAESGRPVMGLQLPQGILYAPTAASSISSPRWPSTDGTPAWRTSSSRASPGSSARRSPSTPHAVPHIPHVLPRLPAALPQLPRLESRSDTLRHLRGDPDRMENRARRLCWHGMLLFLLGLITGLVVQQLRNPRMGLAAHLEGLMNGTFLLALGAAWPHVRLSPRAARAAFGTALYGTYANWVSTTIAAAFGTAAMTPLASGMHKGQSWQEVLVSFGFGSVALAMLVSSALLLRGLRKA